MFDVNDLFNLDDELEMGHIKLAKENNKELSICLIEKGSEIGAHILSGNVFEPTALNELIPDWKGNILVTSLKYEYLERVIVKNGKRVSNEKIFDAGSRVRDVEIDPLGNLYVALENPGRIVKLSKLK